MGGVINRELPIHFPSQRSKQKKTAKQERRQSKMSSSSPDIATKVNNIDRQLSVKDKERLVYLAEVLVNEANKDKSLIVLLADLRHKYCCEKEDSYDILRILLELAGLKKYADILRPQNQFMPPRLENYQYIPDEKCKIVSMRSCLIKLVSSLTTDSLRILLETLCHNIDSNPENYTSIYVLLRELEQRAIISPGRLEFIYEVLEKDDQFANVRKILGKNHRVYTMCVRYYITPQIIS